MSAISGHHLRTHGKMCDCEQPTLDPLFSDISAVAVVCIRSLLLWPIKGHNVDFTEVFCLLLYLRFKPWSHSKGTKVRHVAFHCGKLILLHASQEISGILVKWKAPMVWHIVNCHQAFGIRTPGTGQHTPAISYHRISVPRRIGLLNPLKSMSTGWGGGEDSTFIYRLCRYVPRNKVWFLRFSVLK